MNDLGEDLRRVRPSSQSTGSEPLTTRFRWIPFVLVLTILAGPNFGWAHSFDPALLDLRERADGTFDLIWKAPLRAPSTVTGSGSPPGERTVSSDGRSSIRTAAPVAS